MQNDELNLDWSEVDEAEIDDLDLFAEDMEDRYNAGGTSTFGSASSFSTNGTIACFGTIACACTSSVQ